MEKAQDKINKDNPTIENGKYKIKRFLVLPTK